jgi:diguanylate cyclase (GGDEF)-like protein
MTLSNKIAASPPGDVAKTIDALERENLELKAHIAELERLVVGDTLTPLFNRRHFMAELDRWCWRVHRYGGNNALMFIDVDNLKAVNDAYGHQTGDAMLVEIANGLLASVRKSDLVARIGGDEFGILLDNIPHAELEGKAERLVKAISKLTITHNGKTLNPGISAGYCIIESGVKAVELLQRADRSMYAAKKAKPAISR